MARCYRHAPEPWERPEAAMGRLQNRTHDVLLRETLRTVGAGRVRDEAPSNLQACGRRLPPRHQFRGMFARHEGFEAPLRTPRAGEFRNAGITSNA